MFRCNVQSRHPVSTFSAGRYSRAFAAHSYAFSSVKRRIETVSVQTSTSMATRAGFTRLQLSVTCKYRWHRALTTGESVSATSVSEPNYIRVSY